MDMSTSFYQLVTTTIKDLRSTARRVFMAGVAEVMGGQRKAAAMFGWGRETIRKGQHERDSGVSCMDAFKGPPQK